MTLEELREQAAKVVRELREQINGPWAEEPAVVAMEEAAEFISRVIALPAPVALPQAGEAILERHRFKGDQRELRFRFNEALVGGGSMDGDGGPIIHTDGHAFQLEQAIKVINELRTPTETPTAAAPDDRLIIPKLDPVHAEQHPLLAPIIAKRARAAGNFTPEFSGLRGQDFDRGLLCAFEAVNATLQKMIAALSTATGDEAQQGEGE